MDFPVWVIGIGVLFVFMLISHKKDFEKKIEYQEKQRADDTIREVKIKAEEQVKNAQKTAAEEIRKAREEIEIDKEKLLLLPEKEILVHVASVLNGYNTRLERIEKQMLRIRSDIELDEKQSVYVCNSLTKKFHRLSCSSVDEIAPGKRMYSFEDAETLIDNGYVPCTNCRPDIM